MNKIIYESPKFDFQDLQLLERVADQCWGAGKAWMDMDGDGVHDSSEIVVLPGNGCSSWEGIFETAFGVTLPSNTVNTKDESLIIKPIFS